MTKNGKECRARGQERARKNISPDLGEKEKGEASMKAGDVSREAQKSIPGSRESSTGCGNHLSPHFCMQSIMNINIVCSVFRAWTTIGREWLNQRLSWRS